MMEPSVSKWHLNSSSTKLESLHSMLSRDSLNKSEVTINKTNYNYCKHQQRNNFSWTSTLANLPIQPDTECMLERKSKYARELLRITLVLAVLLSSLIGFGITMSVNSLIMEYLMRGARQFLQSAHQQNTNGQHEQSTESPQAENEDTAVHQEAQRYVQQTQASG